MEINVYSSPNMLYVRIEGRLVLDDCGVFKSVVHPLFDKRLEKVAVDLQKTEFIDSAGLGALVGLKTRANQAEARFYVVEPSQTISDILNVSKLSSIFDLLSGVDAESARKAGTKPEYLVYDSGQGGALPDDTDALPGAEHLVRLAVEAKREGRLEKAVEYCEKAAELDPDDLYVLCELADAYERAPSTRARALSQWERVLAQSQRKGDAERAKTARAKIVALRLEA